MRQFKHNLHVDIETYSEEDLIKSGLYKYAADPSFTILLIAFALDDDDVVCLDMYNQVAWRLPERFSKGTAEPKHLIKERFGDQFKIFKDALLDEEVAIHAHNAAFERICLNRYFDLELDISRMRCSQVSAAFAGLPLSLAQAGSTLGIDGKKLGVGKNLIRLFCVPQKPTKSNQYSTRIYPQDDMEKWSWFITYCCMDVYAELEISERLADVYISDFERELYVLDQEMNDRGIEIDVDLAQHAAVMAGTLKDEVHDKVQQLTGVDNPNSAAQIKDWIADTTGEVVESLNKEVIKDVVERVDNKMVEKVLKLRSQSSKSSVSKYEAMIRCAGEDNRARGLIQYYGANRTGRYAGRLIQVQNLVRNNIDTLDEARSIVRSDDIDMFTMMYDKPIDVLSQLIRTAFIPKKGHTFAVADFSAIEARVIALLSGEQWRIDVFDTHGKIYEASASMMFNVPIEEVTKGSELRQKGKIAELALGFGGGVNALTRMDTSNSIPEEDKQGIIDSWREASPNIVALWRDYQSCAINAIQTGEPQEAASFGVTFRTEGDWLTIQLPSGRKLYYYLPKISVNDFGRMEITYVGQGDNGKLKSLKTYGGKLTENIVQATARDLLALSMYNLDKKGFPIVMHVHDEIIAEVPIKSAEQDLQRMVDVMSVNPSWFKGIKLTADGYITDYYKKD